MMEKLWLGQYQEGVPAEIALDEYASLVDLFEASCQKFSTRTAYISHNHKLSFQELEKLTRYFAAYLQSLGLSPGARIAIMLPNCLQYPVALFAILRAGYIVVNTNPLYTSYEVAHQLEDAGAEAVIVFTPVAHVLQEALPSLPNLKHIILTNLGDCFSFLKRHVVNAVVKHIKKMIPEYHLPQAIPFRDALHNGHNLTYHAPKLHQKDIAFIQYTGGTTGISKGAMLTHQNLLANIAQAAAWMKPLAIGVDDIVITALPLYHIFSLTANCLLFLKAGAQNILITNPRDMTSFIRTLKQSKFTVITGVNTLFNALIHHKTFTTVNFSHLKLALAGGMALQKRVAEQWIKITNLYFRS
jgi:long-chain acyl-CoA synthetase